MNVTLQILVCSTQLVKGAMRKQLSLCEGKGGGGSTLALILTTFRAHFITAGWLLTSSEIDPFDVQLAR